MTVRTQRLFLCSLLALLLLPMAGAAASSCGQPATPIAAIQGQGNDSPMAGQTVTVEGVITRDARVPGGFGGFYLQQADHQTDNDPRTSEALFVYTRRTAGEPGMRVRVTGRVKEYHGLTELVSIKTLSVCGQEPVPEAVTVSLPWSAPAESLENMRVRFDQQLTVIDSYNLGRYGELTLAPTDQVKATEYLPPGSSAVEVARRNRDQRLLLDDGRRQTNPRPTPWPPGGLTPERTVRAGDRINGLIGTLDFRFGDWRLQPESPPRFEQANPRRSPPPRPAEPHIRIVTMNLANYFNGDGRGQGFPTPRGAKHQAGYQDQHQRLLAALKAPDPDILALTEVENDGYGPDSAVSDLAHALGPNWRLVETPGADGADEIRTTLLFRQDRVTAIGAPARLTRGLFQHRGRPPVSQTFRAREGGKAFRVVAVHLKSKSCRNASGADRDQNNGEGCYASRRSNAARAILDWLLTLSESPDLAGTLITGDLNAYAQETPLAVFRAGGFTSLVHDHHPCTPDACRHYTYRYKGEKGSLDYALASDSLRPRVLTAATWLLNADEPRALGYGGPVDTAHPLPWRSSDHNPVITDLRY
ncbi:ExeM/NucH family extracellular endonuclease [Marinobacter arenosus]|uniref:ExeM/NucH family extracellular endonuclease n=1 Tax=Marinobacter arenosus TaxID=2856822 RepID=UPI001C4DB970|nr:ExeM/NucH family extracellular endonuclease [Marinobacter arenosus]MBW0148203.1 ExeM/NucH family extracellular endonuclease [Marinobacter arenosus]